MKPKFNLCHYSLPIILIFQIVITTVAHAENIRLKVGIYNNPPIIFIDEKSNPQGVYVDILNTIAQKENWTLDYVFGQWEELLGKIKAGDIDLITGIAYSQERNAWLDFNQEAFVERWGVVYAKPGASIHAMADLNGKRIALAKQDIHAGFFKQASDALGIELTVLEVGGYEAVFEALKNHNADVGVVSNGYGDSNAERYGFEPTSLTFKPMPLMVAFPKGRHSRIAGILDGYLKLWKGEPDSVYLTSYQRWIGAPRGQSSLITLTPEQRIWLANHKTIRVAFDGYYPPYSYLDNEGQIKGMALDILKAITDRLGIRLEIHPTYVWKELSEAAKKSEVDVVANMVHTLEREEWFSFTQPYVYKSLVIMTQEDNDTIKSPEDIAGKRVALVRGYQGVSKVIQDFPTIKPVYVDTMLEGLNAVATHRADAVVTFFGAGRYFQIHYGITNLKFAAIYDRNSSLDSIAVRKDWPELAAILDKALVALKDTEIEALRQKWNSDEILLSRLQSDQLSARQKTLLVSLSVLLGLLLLVSIIVISWNRTLRWKVKIKTQALEKELVKGLEAKTEIEKGKKEWETTFDAMSDWVCLIDSGKQILCSNAAGKNILDLPIKNIVGQNCCELIHGFKGSIVDCPVDKMLETRQRETIEYYDPILKKWMSIATEPVFDEDGNIIHAVHIVKDISEQKELEAHLMQAKKMESIGTLTGGVAHDFNNIMGIILGNTELALEDVPEWNPAHSNLEEIKKASLRAANIVRQLLSFTRKTDHKLQPMEIAIVIKDSLRFLRSTIPTFIDIEQNISVTDETILADPTQINQIMMNLCINASHAMEQTSGKLTINVENVLLDNDSAKDYPDLKSGRHIKVMVGDTGPGIDPKIIGRIFDPYFTTKGIGKGSGMGLAVVHGIVKSHGGSIKVDSTLGKGTKFSILFPLAQEKAAVEAKTIQEMPRGKETILFVDDEISIVNMVQRMFERLGYKVQTATTPQDALDRFALNPDHFDLVITDMTMPQMTGVNLSEKLMDIRPDIPIIICTGYSALVDEEKAKELGLAAYVMKPINMSEIAQTIRKVLDRK